MTVEISNRLEIIEKQMVRWMCGVSLRDRVPSKELKERRLNWSDEEEQVKVVETCTVGK